MPADQDRGEMWNPAEEVLRTSALSKLGRSSELEVGQALFAALLQTTRGLFVAARARVLARKVPDFKFRRYRFATLSAGQALALSTSCLSCRFLIFSTRTYLFARRAGKTRAWTFAAGWGGERLYMCQLFVATARATLCDANLLLPSACHAQRSNSTCSTP